MGANLAAARLTALSLLFVAGLEGQDVSPRGKRAGGGLGETAAANIRITAGLVEVPVTVTDPLGRSVTGLGQEHFRVFDNDVEQTISRFAMDNQPLGVCFVFDVSGSIGHAIPGYRMAAHEFFRAAEPEDDFCLVTFESSPKLAVPLTKRAAEIEYQILMTRSQGRTALFDAVYLAAHEVKKSKAGRKALLLISDGGENQSRYSYAEIKNALRESDLLLYSIGPSPYRSGGQSNGQLLKDLAEMTGGRLIEFDSPRVASIAERIIIDLRNRFVLYYKPPGDGRDGRFRRIRVQMIQPRGLPKLTPHWRRGYYASTQ